MAYRKRGFRIHAKKHVNVGRVVAKIVGTAILLWVGSSILVSVAATMNNTVNIFSQGLTLIGFGYNTTSKTMDGTVSSTGLLSVIGLFAMASIVMEFIDVQW